MKTPTHVMPNENPMMLKLKRPIVFLDIQTTGRDVRTARIVRLSTLRIAADGTEELRSHLINPLMPISPGASQFHGIHDYDVHDAKPFVAFAKAPEQLPVRVRLGRISDTKIPLESVAAGV